MHMNEVLHLILLRAGTRVPGIRDPEVEPRDCRPYGSWSSRPSNALETYCTLCRGSRRSRIEAEETYTSVLIRVRPPDAQTEGINWFSVVACQAPESPECARAWGGPQGLCDSVPEKRASNCVALKMFPTRICSPLWNLRYLEPIVDLLHVQANAPYSRRAHQA